MVHRLEDVLVCHGCSCADRRRKTALQLLWKTATLLSSCSLIHAKSQQLGCSHERGVSIMTYMSAWLRMSSAFSKSDSGGGQTNGRTRERSVRGGSSSTFEGGLRWVFFIRLLPPCHRCNRRSRRVSEQIGPCCR